MPFKTVDLAGGRMDRAHLPTSKGEGFFPLAQRWRLRACALAQVTAKTSYEKAGKLLGSNPAWEAMEDTTRRPSERTEQTEGERQWQSQSCQSHPAGKMTWGKWVRCSLDAMGHGFDYFLRVLCLICRGHARNNAHNTLFELSTSSARSAPHEVQVLFSV